MKRLRKATKTKCLGLDSNWVPPEHMSEALPLEPASSVMKTEKEKMSSNEYNYP
jgi:hypothetical protein